MQFFRFGFDIRLEIGTAAPIGYPVNWQVFAMPHLGREPVQIGLRTSFRLRSLTFGTDWFCAGSLKCHAIFRSVHASRRSHGDTRPGQSSAVSPVSAPYQTTDRR